MVRIAVLACAGRTCYPSRHLLTLVSRRTADGNAICLWLYANNWTSTYITVAGFRDDFLVTARVSSFPDCADVRSWTFGSSMIPVTPYHWSNAAFLSFGLLFGALFLAAATILSLWVVLKLRPSIRAKQRRAKADNKKD